jgi:putative endonuclease
VGRYGEDLACRFLVSHGMVVLERNWRCREGEIDIVAVDGATIVVCEVKTRTTAAYGPPQEAVTWRKAARLRALARLWLDGAWARDMVGPTGGGARRVRVDVIAVTLPPRGAAVVEHLRDAC